MLEEIRVRQKIYNESFLESVTGSMSNILTGNDTANFSPTILEQTRNFLEESNFKYKKTADYEQEKNFLGLLSMTMSLNGNKLKDAFMVDGNNEINLNYRALKDKSASDIFVDLTQKNFMYNKKILNLIPIRHLIINKSKLKELETYKDLFEKCFDSLQIHKSETYDVNEIINNLKKGEELKLRVLGTNHIFLKTEFNAVKKFLDKVPENLRSQITVELLSKTGTNRSFREDDKPEIEIMKKMAKKHLSKYNVAIQPVTFGKHANTLGTIVAADKLDSLNDPEKTSTLYFLCPNALNRQIYDIELHNLKNGYGTRHSATSKKIYFDGCGGYVQLEKDIKGMVDKNNCLANCINNYNKDPSIKNLENFVLINKNYDYLLRAKKQAELSKDFKRMYLNFRIRQEMYDIKRKKLKHHKVMNYFLKDGVKISNALCETAKQSFVSREIARRQQQESVLNK